MSKKIFGWFKNLKKDERNLVIMFLIAIVAVGVYFGVNIIKDINAKKKAKKTKPKYVFSNFRRQNINYIEIKNNRDDSYFIIKKINGKWKFVEPKNLLCDSSSVETYLLTVESMTYDSYLPAKKVKDDKIFGFDKPQLIALFKGKENDAEISFKLILGGESPVANNYYLRKNNDKSIFVINGMVFNALLARIDDMRNKRIFSPISRQEIGYVQFINNIDGITNTFYYFNQKWIWKFGNHEEIFGAESNAVKILLDRIAYFGVNKFLKEKPEYDKPDYKIIVESMDKKKRIVIDLIEPDTKEAPENKEYTLINLNNGEVYKAYLTMLYTYFTDNPVEFGKILQEKLKKAEEKQGDQEKENHN